MNLRLAEYFSEFPNVFVLDSNKWAHRANKTAFNPKMWYMGKIPFSNELFLEAVKDIKAAINGINGMAKKLVITDLDEPFKYPSVYKPSYHEIPEPITPPTPAPSIPLSSNAGPSIPLSSNAGLIRYFDANEEIAIKLNPKIVVFLGIILGIVVLGLNVYFGLWP